MKNIDKLQNLLPLGYLFLILLGITKETIFYYQIGINIIKYSSIMDILISPIAAVTSHPVFFITISVFFVLFYYLPQILLKNQHKKWLHKMFGMDNTSSSFTELSENEKKEYYTTNSISFLSFFLLCLFLGYGLADGKSISEKIKNNQLHYDSSLSFNDDKTEKTYIIGSNSIYFFYLTEGNQHIKIAPVSSIKNIELIKNRMLNK